MYADVAAPLLDGYLLVLRAEPFTSVSRTDMYERYNQARELVLPTLFQMAQDAYQASADPGTSCCFLNARPIRKSLATRHYVL